MCVYLFPLLADKGLRSCWDKNSACCTGVFKSRRLIGWLLWPQWPYWPPGLCPEYWPFHNQDSEVSQPISLAMCFSYSCLYNFRIVAEDSLPFRKRRQVGSATQTTTTVTLEFGDPPEVNISQPTAPSVAEEIQMSGEVNDSVDIEVSKLCIHTLFTLHT